MTYVPVAEAAKTIRTKLKAMGLGQKQVSVRSESYSGGSSIRVYIKDVTIPKAKVEAVANEQQEVHYCEYTHEILSGGNRFVFVDYDYEAMRAAAAPLIAEMPTEDNRIATVRGFEVIREGPEFVIFPKGLDGNDPSRRAWGVDAAARVVVGLLAEQVQP